MLDGGGATFNSLRREPTLTRAIGDAILGRRLPARPGFLSETDSRPAGYREVHNVDWATGAALLVPATVFREVGPWGTKSSSCTRRRRTTFVGSARADASFGSSRPLW